MHISLLTIRNFRNFINARFLFTAGVNTLIGENGSGKTNAFQAIRILLDDSLPRNAAQLREGDFCRALNDWRGHWVIISARFEDLDAAEGCQILKHATGHMDASSTGSLTFFFRPNLEARSTLHQLSQGGHLDEIKNYLRTLTIDSYEPFLTGRATGDFSQDDLYRLIAGNHSTLKFPDPKDDDQELLGVRISPIYSEVTCTFAQALRDVVSDLRGYRSNPLLALLRGMESNIQIENATRITTAVADLNAEITALPEIKSIASGIQSTLHSTVGHTYSPSVSIESALPNQIDKLLQKLTVTVGDDPSSNYRGELAEQSLGGANLIYLALKLLEYEVKLSSDRVAHFLLIEEPEAHIHTHIQKTLFDHQPTKKTQVIVSTHSTHISSAAKVKSINVLARGHDHAEVFQPAAGLTAIQVSRLERYLDAVRSTLLFAKGVILVEGEAELIMIPAMLRTVFGISPDEMGISILSMDSAFFQHVAAVFHHSRIKRRCSIITDLDASLTELPSTSEDDDLQASRARAAQEAGESRKKALDQFVFGNPLVRAFFATHTFEVEFLEAGNLSPIEEAIDTIYSRTQDRERSKEVIRSTDLAVSGQGILRLAKKYGKGWFALLVSEKLAFGTTAIPSYILRAVAASTLGISRSAIGRMAEYRVGGGGDLGAKSSSITETEELLSIYRENFPEDPLTQFMTYQLELHGDDLSQP